MSNLLQYKNNAQWTGVCVNNEIGDFGEEFQSRDPKKSILQPSSPQAWGVHNYMFRHILRWGIQQMFRFPGDKFCEWVNVPTWQMFQEGP